MLKAVIIILTISLVACADKGQQSNNDNNKDQNATNVAKEEVNDRPRTDLPLHLIELPEGYEIDIYAEDVPNARQMELSPGGTLFVGSRSAGNVYALRDADGDGYAEEKHIIYSDGFQPNGVAFRDGDLYVSEINRILRFADIENKLEDPGEPEVVYDQYPSETHHGWKYIGFGPDGILYVPVGAPCNICKSEREIFASITTLDVETREMNILHRGIRNTVGFNWHPETGDLWFTDNGGDWLGDNMPADELNHATEPGMHFGYPYCHQGSFPDPDLGSEGVCDKYTPPAQKLGPHVAALGMEFDTHWPHEAENRILIAEHGSWNRSVPIGYRIMQVPLDGQKALGYEVFAEGWLQDGKDWGRPVDLEWMPDGSLLVSDDKADAIYRISRTDN